MNSVKNKYHLSHDTMTRVDIVVSIAGWTALLLVSIPFIALNLWRSVISQVI